MIPTIIFVVFPFAMIYAALSDMFTMTIANRVSALLIVTFLAVAPFIGLTWTEFERIGVMQWPHSPSC